MKSDTSIARSMWFNAPMATCVFYNPFIIIQKFEIKYSQWMDTK